ncbi:enterochelin esterase [Marinicauda algicola]|uniref:Enterochelin esterase n=1 Tax=Marinicauda algicola TaxID=2029849 RepID=A0A4S2GYY1_9PROT|nr:alpha/beta hydrolase-fold protein [Marinicauda algicola]TGY88450.1 enterochelin esterase [Marinicauda algicola]
MTARHAHPAGTVHRLFVESQLLKDNFLGDPVRRAIDVWTPHGHGGQGLPLLVSLAGYTGSGLSHTSWKNFGENVPERLDRLYGEGRLEPCVVAFPDCYTRLGGNQYVNSAVMGPWEDILISEFVPAVEENLGCGGEGRRAVFGKSSGGYGAIVHALKHAGFWAGAACHSGDMAFELAYLKDMPATLRRVARKGSVKDFVEAFEAARKPSGDDIHALMILAMAATYDPDPKSLFGIRLPVDPHTCELIEERWAQWRACDPLTLVESHGQNLKRLKALFIDCGRLDQYDLVYGARRLTRRLTALGVPHRYEEFDDDHSGIDYRLDESLPWLAERLA